ncbi:hypothetical protein, partial [Mesorhizobium sp. M7A.F.Ca.US.007.01.1.1]|uniref:hypothetical protein n=1 Tax=Mesorhizobium sp. M7A.F.Ca.US.007.01.1.1 TaxID=2496712 RepID=UPI0019D1FF99
VQRTKQFVPSTISGAQVDRHSFGGGESQPCEWIGHMCEFDERAPFPGAEESQTCHLPLANGFDPYQGS